MAKKLSATVCETVKANPARDRLIGDGDGLYLRVRPHGTKTWVIEYEFQGKRTKYTIGGYDRNGAPGNSIPDWLPFTPPSGSRLRRHSHLAMALHADSRWRPK